MLTDRNTIVPTFAGGTLDRADQVRVNPDKLRTAMMNPRAKLLKLDGLNPVLTTMAISPGEPPMKRRQTMICCCSVLKIIICSPYVRL